MRISDWSSDVCSSDLAAAFARKAAAVVALVLDLLLLLLVAVALGLLPIFRHVPPCSLLDRPRTVARHAVNRPHRRKVPRRIARSRREGTLIRDSNLRLHHEAIACGHAGSRRGGLRFGSAGRSVRRCGGEPLRPAARQVRDLPLSG